MEIRGEFDFLGRKYPVIIRKKRQKRVVVRYNGVEFLVSAPTYLPKFVILKIASPIFEKFLQNSKNDVHTSENAISGLYIFGEFHKIDDGFIDVLGHQVLFSDLNTFYKNIKPIIYDKFLRLFRECEDKIHSLKRHEFKLVSVKGYYGQNVVGKNLIKININLVHFHDDVIKSVMYHELAHDFVTNHSKLFYEKLKSFDPNYKEYHSIITNKNYEETLL